MDDGTVFEGAWNGNNYVEFKGLRYGQPPTGTARWAAPVEVSDYEGQHLDLTEYMPKCAFNGWDGQTDVYSEDCLSQSLKLHNIFLYCQNQGCPASVYFE